MDRGLRITVGNEIYYERSLEHSLSADPRIHRAHGNDSTRYYIFVYNTYIWTCFLIIQKMSVYDLY